MPVNKYQYEVESKVESVVVSREIHFSAREAEVMGWAAQGKSNWEISLILSISDATVKSYITQCYRKLRVHNRTHAVALALRKNLIQIPEPQVLQSDVD